MKVFGFEQVESPKFEFEVIWLKLGSSMLLHLIERDPTVMLPEGPWSCSTAAVADPKNLPRGKQTPCLFLCTRIRLLCSESKELAHARGALVLVDNSIMSPVLSQPLELRADIVMHSATKFIPGHRDLMAGVLAIKGERKEPKFIAKETKSSFGHDLFSNKMNVYLDVFRPRLKDRTG